jgi:glutamate:GABA antiporter
MATADSEITGSRSRRNRSRLASEIVPEQVLPKVLSTFDGIALYVYIIFFINASAIIALGGWSTTQFQILGVLVFMIPSAMAVAELGGVWPAEGGIYVWASKTMPGWLAFFGGFFSWAPIILNAATHPAIVLALIELAFPSFQPSTTESILLYLVFMWIPICIALMKLRVSRNAANTVFVYYMALVVLVIVVGVSIAVSHGHPANPVHPHMFTTFNFAIYGSFFGLILLNFLGVEAPFNMGAEVIEARRTLLRTVLWGSVIIVAAYLFVTTAILLATPVKSINAPAGALQVLDEGIHSQLFIKIIALSMIAVILMADVTYQQTFSRLLYVSGLERHLPRIFTHINPRTKNPVTALLFTGALTSVVILVFYSQSSLQNTFLILQGALTVTWLIAGIFFFVPVPLARRMYHERYGERFWRIPGGFAGALITVGIGLLASLVGIYYTLIEPFSPSISKATWTASVAGMVGALVLLAAVIYVAGSRSGRKTSEEELLASLIPASENPAATPNDEVGGPS